MTVSTVNALAGLAGRLTDPEDRERYAAIIAYIQRLPAEDEFRRLAELLGLLSLMGERIPVAAAELLSELRSETRSMAERNTAIESRLASLPADLAAGVDLAKVAESFRQQIARSGLHEAALQLDTTNAQVKNLASEFVSVLRPAMREMRGVTATMTTEVARLAANAEQLREQNRRLEKQMRLGRFALHLVVLFVVFLAGGVAGIVLAHR